MWWIYPTYAIDLIAMIVLSFVLGNLVDALDKKTKISGAFIGGVLLAAVTSLPELFTALSSIFLVNEPEYVVGDLLGSIVFDLVCLALEIFLFVKNFRDAKIQKFHIVNAGATLVMFGLAAYAFFAPQNAQLMLGDINVISIVIFALYILTLIFQPKESESDDDEKEEIKMSLKKIIIFFILSSVALIGTSVALTYLTKLIQNELPALSGSVAGALLLGIGTSVPEIISTAQLFKKKNYDAGIGNMIGSCTFDFGIFALADFLTWHQYNNAIDSTTGEFIISQRGLYILSTDSMQFELFGIGVCALVFVFLLAKCFWKAFDNKKWLAYTLTGIVAVGALAMYLLIFIL